MTDDQHTLDGRRTFGRLLLAAALFSALLSGCSSSGTEASPPGSGGEPPQLDAAELDEVHRNDLEHEQTVDWGQYEVADDTSIRVFFTTGSEDCYGARAEVEETATTVEVAVITGSLPDAPTECTLVGKETSILVETVHPVADREIIQLTDPAVR